MAILSLNKKITAIIPNINFVATASIMTLLKNNFILCDVNRKTGMVDLESFKKYLEIVKKVLNQIYLYYSLCWRSLRLIN